MGSAIELFLVRVQCAQEAADGVVRNAALGLLQVLAGALPALTLEHMLDVVAAVGASAAVQDDDPSHQIAASTLAAIVPAWLAAGKTLSSTCSSCLCDGHVNQIYAVQLRHALECWAFLCF